MLILDRRAAVMKASFSPLLRGEVPGRAMRGGAEGPDKCHV